MTKEAFGDETWHGMRRRIADLEEAIRLMGLPRCEHLHHDKKFQHGSGPCPLVSRINQLLGAEGECIGGSEHNPVQGFISRELMCDKCGAHLSSARKPEGK